MNSQIATETRSAEHYSPVKPMPFLDLKAQFEAIRDEVMAAVTGVMESQHFILGPEVEALEREVANHVGARYAVGCASGSDALLLALLAGGIAAGDEVITTPFTFVATAGAIVRIGARPVFVDIDRETFNIDAGQIERAITPRTKAILPVHLFGLMADMDPILKIAAKHGLIVVEDAAQAIGASYRGKQAGSLGAFGCFSFFPSKNLGGAGDGGMVTSDDETLGDRLKLLRAHGSRKKYEYEILGVNSRLDSLQAAILRVKLRHLDEWAAGRQRNADRYRALLCKYGLAGKIKAPSAPTDYGHVYNQFTIRVTGRDSLRAFLKQRGIPTEVYYPSPLHLQRAFAYLGYQATDFPEAESASREVIAMPIYPELHLEKLESIVQAISDFYQAR